MSSRVELDDESDIVRYQSDIIRYQSDILVTEEKSIRGVIREWENRSKDIHRVLRRRRRDGPKPGVKRRNKRWFTPFVGGCYMLMYPGEYWNVRPRHHRPSPFAPDR